MGDFSLRHYLAGRLQDAALDALMDYGLPTTPPCPKPRHNDHDCARCRLLAEQTKVIEQDWDAKADELIAVLTARFHAQLDPAQIDENEPVRKFTRETLRRDPDTNEPLPREA